MTFRNFAIGLTCSFALAWLLVVVVPFFKLRHPAPVSFREGVDTKEGIYHPKRAGRVTNGAQVYAENGCYQCHTQVIRPTYAGNDLGRPDWGGLAGDPDRGDTRRESNQFDYLGESFAQVGVTRVGPDLSNFGRRVRAAKGAEAEAWTLMRLYNPRLDPQIALWSSCPPLPFLFEEETIHGPVPNNAVKVVDGKAVLPGPKAKALASYLLSLQRDDEVPSSMDYSPADDKEPQG